ncbi:MAG: hypothetical protein ACREAA_14285 [Candidatus Polarisedimenticolia bacterium]
MSGRIARLVVMAAACALVASIPAQAEPVCNGTLVVAAAETMVTGSICNGSYTTTQTSNNVRECLQEALSGGIAKLSHTWRFDNVPAGTISLIYEGNRPNNADGDNFKFSGHYYTEEGPYFILMPGAIINSPLELQGGFQHFTNWDLPYQTSFYINIRDTAGGTNLDTVNIDYLAVCSESELLE